MVCRALVETRLFCVKGYSEMVTRNEAAGPPLIEVIQLQRKPVDSSYTTCIVHDHKGANRSGWNSVVLVNVGRLLVPMLSHDHLIDVAGNVKALVAAPLSEEEARDLGRQTLDVRVLRDNVNVKPALRSVGGSIDDADVHVARRRRRIVVGYGVEGGGIGARAI